MIIKKLHIKNPNFQVTILTETIFLRQDDNVSSQHCIQTLLLMIVKRNQKNSDSKILTSIFTPVTIT